MQTPEQSESEASDALVTYGYTLVKHYVECPGDVEAALLAVLTRAIERIIQREVSIYDFYQ